jgi:hypothetical protein
VLVVDGKAIVEAFNNGKVVWNYKTKYGLRDFIAPNTRSLLSRRFNALWQNNRVDGSC